MHRLSKWNFKETNKNPWGSYQLESWVEVEAHFWIIHTEHLQEQ
jgi:hypothetical protein